MAWECGTCAVRAVASHGTQTGMYRVTLAHCGDSRGLVWLRGQARLDCTTDHKPGYPEEFVRIRTAGSWVTNGRIYADPGLNTSRALGDFNYKQPPSKPPEANTVTCVPHISTIYATPGDWVLLACDGLYDVWTNDELTTYISMGHVPKNCALARLVCVKKDTHSNNLKANLFIQSYYFLIYAPSLLLLKPSVSDIYPTE